MIAARSCDEGCSRECFVSIEVLRACSASAWSSLSCTGRNPSGTHAYRPKPNDECDTKQLPLLLQKNTGCSSTSNSMHAARVLTSSIPCEVSGTFPNPARSRRFRIASPKPNNGMLRAAAVAQSIPYVVYSATLHSQPGGWFDPAVQSRWNYSYRGPNGRRFRRHLRSARLFI